MSEFEKGNKEKVNSFGVILYVIDEKDLGKWVGNRVVYRDWYKIYDMFWRW